MVKQDELDLKSPGAAKFKPLEWRKRSELVAALDAGLAEAREALQNTTDENSDSPGDSIVGEQVVTKIYGTS